MNQQKLVQVKKPTQLTVFIALVVLIYSSLAFAHNQQMLHGPHQHNQASVIIEQQQNEITATLIIPTSNVVGFERIAETAGEKRKVRDAYYWLIDHTPIKIDGCTASEASIQSAIFDDHGAEDDTDPPQGKPEATNHIDLRARYVFHCQSQPSSYHFTDFAHFPFLERVLFYMDNTNQASFLTLTAK